MCFYCESRLLLRRGAEWLTGFVFFSLFFTLFAISLGVEEDLWVRVCPSVMWMGFFFTVLLSVEKGFRQEYGEGSVYAVRLSAFPAWWIVLAKILAYWFVLCCPLVAMMPCFLVTLSLSFIQIGWVTASVLLGAVPLVSLSYFVCSLTSAQGSALLALLALPLYMPVVFLGESVFQSVLQGNSPLIPFAFLASLSALALTGLPYGIAAALEEGIE